MFRKIVNVVSLVGCVALTACNDAPPLVIDAGNTPDWQVDAPERHGFDVARLDAARAYAFKPTYYTQGVVIIKDGYLVAEWYADDAGPDSYATSWSVGKSFVSALVGIALDDGLIPSVDEPMTTYIPEWKNSDRAAIKLRASQAALDILRQWLERIR